MVREAWYFEGLPRDEGVKWRLQEGKEGYVPSQSGRRENTRVLEDTRFMPDQIMYDTLSEGKISKKIKYQKSYGSRNIYIHIYIYFKDGSTSVS